MFCSVLISGNRMPSTTNSAKSLLTKSNKAKILKEEREREKSLWKTQSQGQCNISRSSLFFILA